MQTLEAYEKMLELKAATLTAALTEGIAMISEANASTRRALMTCGWELGMAIQIVNDYMGIWRPERMGKRPGGDLAQAQWTYPIFYALTVPHPDRDEFEALLNTAADERNTDRMLEILNTIGAPAFMWAAIAQRKTRAFQAVQEISPAGAAEFESWFQRHLQRKRD